MTPIAQDLTAKEIMQKSPLTIGADDSIEKLLETLRKHNITGLPVVDPAGKLVGVVSISDIIRYASGNTPGNITIRGSLESADYYTYGCALEYEYMDGSYTDNVRNARVKDIMTSDLQGVDESTTVTELAKILYEKRIHRVIVTANGTMTGIVTTMDFVKLFV